MVNHLHGKLTQLVYDKFLERSTYFHLTQNWSKILVEKGRGTNFDGSQAEYTYFVAYSNISTISKIKIGKFLHVVN